MQTARIRAGASILALLVALAAFAPGASGQSTVSAQMSFNQNACYLGDEITLEIAVENAENVEAPDLSSLPGAGFRFRGTSNESRTLVSLVNGQRREERLVRRVMRWTVTPNELGTVIVPPQLIGIGNGQVVETNEARIRVLEPERETRPVLIVTPESTEVYVNQPVRVSVSWLLTANVEEFSFRASKADEGLLIQPIQRQRATLDRAYAIDIFDGSATGMLGYGTIEGRRTRSLDFELLVTPTKPGVLELGPITVSYDEQVSRVSNRRVVAQAEPVRLTVREMPREGRPESFAGLLGTHDISVEAGPTAVSVGDPINLEVTIYGPEPMAAITDGPDLGDVEGFESGFRVASEGWTFRQGSRPGERRFTTVIRVTDPSVTEIPSIPLAFFDPGEGEYRVARSDPIPLQVRAVREVTAADAVVSSAAPSAVSRDPLSPTAPSVWAIERGPGVLASSDPIGSGTWSRPVLVGAAIAPPVCFLGALLVVARRRSPADPDAARRRRALARARRALASEGAVASVKSYLADAFGASPEAITGADGERLLRGAGVDDPLPVIELIAAHEAAQYARQGGGVRPTPTGHGSATCWQGSIVRFAAVCPAHREARREKLCLSHRGVPGHGVRDAGGPWV